MKPGNRFLKLLFIESYSKVVLKERCQFLQGSILLADKRVP